MKNLKNMILFLSPARKTHKDQTLTMPHASSVQKPRRKEKVQFFHITTSLWITFMRGASTSELQTIICNPKKNNVPVYCLCPTVISVLYQVIRWGLRTQLISINHCTTPEISRNNLVRSAQRRRCPSLLSQKTLPKLHLPTQTTKQSIANQANSVKVDTAAPN